MSDSTDPVPLRWPTKDPDETLDYSINWTPRLSAGDPIASVVWVLPDALNQEDAGFLGAITTLWISGGVAGAQYKITCRVTTDAGRIMDQGVLIKIMEK